MRNINGLITNCINSPNLGDRNSFSGIWYLNSQLNQKYYSCWPYLPPVMDSLYVYLDPNTYSGSGSTWYDYTSTAYNGTLNNPIFANTYPRYFTFNGTSDIVSFSTTYLNTNDNFSYDIWCKPNAMVTMYSEGTSGVVGGAQKYLVYPPSRGASNGGAGISLGTNGIGVFEHGDSYLPCLASYTATISSTVFSHIVVVYTNKQPKIYINNSLVRTGLTSLRTNVNPGTTIGGGTYGYFKGDVAEFAIYTKSLSTDEIAINYNDRKGKYGL